MHKTVLRHKHMISNLCTASTQRPAFADKCTAFAESTNLKAAIRKAHAQTQTQKRMHNHRRSMRSIYGIRTQTHTFVHKCHSKQTAAFRSCHNCDQRCSSQTWTRSKNERHLQCTSTLELTLPWAILGNLTPSAHNIEKRMNVSKD